MTILTVTLGQDPDRQESLLRGLRLAEAFDFLYGWDGGDDDPYAVRRYRARRLILSWAAPGSKQWQEACAVAAEQTRIHGKHYALSERARRYLARHEWRPPLAVSRDWLEKWYPHHFPIKTRWDPWRALALAQAAYCELQCQWGELGIGLDPVSAARLISIIRAQATGNCNTAQIWTLRFAIDAILTSGPDDGIAAIRKRIAKLEAEVAESAAELADKEPK